MRFHFHFLLRIDIKVNAAVIKAPILANNPTCLLIFEFGFRTLFIKTQRPVATNVPNVLIATRCQTLRSPSMTTDADK